MGFISNESFEKAERVMNRKGGEGDVERNEWVGREYRQIDESELVQLNIVTKLDAEKYEDFTAEKYPLGLNFYDFEVFMFDWCVTIVNPVELTRTTIANDARAFKRYYNKHKNQIWVGYNSRGYDTFIAKALLLGMNPKEVNDKIIFGGMKGWQISRDFNKVYFLNFDIYTKNSLKVCEGFMGNDIHESEVDFNIERKLNVREMRQTVRYNVYDVEQTIEVFRRNTYLYVSQLQLIETFGMPIELISKTQAQLTAEILECERQEHDDEFEIDIVDTLRLRKYEGAMRWFQSKANMNYSSSFTMDVCGVPHQYGWGGIHGCPVKPLHIKGKLFHVDVNSYYPSEIIVYNFMTRNSNNPGRYEDIYRYRLKLKAEGKKKEQAPYKIVLNGTYGIMKDKYSLAYDPKMANNICANGQLMLTDLLERIEPYVELVQSNTDGIIVYVPNEENVPKFMEMCRRWEKRTGMGLAYDEIKEIWQKDVNNFLMIFANGKVERKGAYVMELDELNYDLPIVNKALVDYFTKNVPVETTINGCDELKEFQKIVKVSSAYAGGWHNNEYLRDKTFRVFASTNPRDTYLGKYKKVGATIEKFGNTPEHAFINNGNVNGVKCGKNLDKRWYVRLARKRLADFGIELGAGGLF